MAVSQKLGLKKKERKFSFLNIFLKSIDIKTSPSLRMLSETKVKELMESFLVNLEYNLEFDGQQHRTTPKHRHKQTRK